MSDFDQNENMELSGSEDGQETVSGPKSQLKTITDAVSALAENQVQVQKLVLTKSVVSSKIDFKVMKSNPNSGNISILESELLLQQQASHERDLTKLIAPKVIVAIGKLFLSNALQETYQADEMDWKKWSDEKLLRHLRDCVGCTVSSRQDGDQGTEKCIEGLKKISWSVFNFDTINQFDNYVTEALGEVVRNSTSKHSMAKIRSAIFEIFKECPLGMAMVTKFLEKQSELMVSPKPREAGNDWESKPDYSWNVFTGVLYKQHTKGTQAIVSAETWGGSLLVAVWTRNGRYKRPLEGDTDSEAARKKEKNAKWRESVANIKAHKEKQTLNAGGTSASKEEKVKDRSATDKLVCYGCGRQYHSADKCTLRTHPDRNKDENKTWDESLGGIAWKKRDELFLPHKKVLNGTEHVPLPRDSKKPLVKAFGLGLASLKNKGIVPTPITYGCALCHDTETIKNINHTLSHDLHEPVLPYDDNGIRTCTLINPNNANATPVRLRVLQDTGALGMGSNYISLEASRTLKEAGFLPKAVDEILCSCFVGSCKPVTEMFKLRLNLFNESLNSNVTVTVECRVADIAHDIIIGRKKIERCKTLQDLLMQSLDSMSGYESDNDQELDDDREEILDDGGHDPWSREVHPSPGSVMVNPDQTKTNQLNATLNTTSNDTSEEYQEPKEFGGPEDLQREARAVCRNYKKTITKHLNPIPAYVTPMVVELTGEWGGRNDQQPPRQQSRLKADEIREQTSNMLKANVIAESMAAAHSQVMMTVKPNGTWRFCIDYRRLNVVTKPNTYPLPKIKDILNRIGDKKPKYFAVIDLTKGYYQAPLSEESRELTSFITPFGKFEWLRVAMGLTGAPSYFQRAMADEVLQGLVRNICEVYLDDIIIYGKTKEEFLENLDTVLARLEKFNVSVNPDKCRIGLTSIEYVGHVIDETGLNFSREKIAKVIQMERPVTTADLKSYVGIVNYFRDHCRNAAARMAPLNQLLEGYNKKVKVKINWDDNPEALEAFTDSKQMINDLPKLFFVDDHSDVHLYTDASKKGIGAYLCQIVEGKEIPIGFYSKSLNKQEKNWGIPELEGYAIFAAFKHWDYLLRDAHTHVHTDHKNLVYIRDTGSEKVIRWKMSLQEYSFDTEFVAGVDNPIADYWSRNEAAEEDDYSVETPTQVANMLCQLTLQRRTKTLNLNASKTGTSWLKYNIPEKEYELIEKVHNSSIGHHGVNDTLQMLTKQKWRWPYMRQNVKRFIKECDLCQKATFRHYHVKVPKYTTGSYLPMERWNIDTMGPFPPDEFGNIYAIVIVDCFTRFVTLYASKTKDADEAAEIMVQQMGHYGTPAQFLSDNGGEYINDIIGELLNMTGTEHVSTIAHSHEENSIVERHNAEIGRWLREILYEHKLPILEEEHTEWSKYLPFVQRIHNTKKIGFLGYSPAQMLYGDRVNLDRSILLPPEERPGVAGEETTAWMTKQRQIQDKILAKAKKLQEEKDLRHTDDSVPEYTVYEDGSYVLQDYPDTGINLGRPNKLHMMRTGPYQVISHSGNLYTVKNLVTEQEEIKGIWLLRPFIFDANRTDPKSIALKDHAETFNAEEIRSHDGNWSRKTQMKFVVKWEGHTETTVEPWKNVSNSRAMQTYLKELKLENMAPGYVPDRTTPEARKIRKRKNPTPKATVENPTAKKKKANKK